MMEGRRKNKKKKEEGRKRGWRRRRRRRRRRTEQRRRGRRWRRRRGGKKGRKKKKKKIKKKESKEKDEQNYCSTTIHHTHPTALHNIIGYTDPGFWHSAHKTFTISPKKFASCKNSWHSMINESLLQSCDEYHSQTKPEANTQSQKSTGAEDQRYYRQQRRAARHASADSLTLGARCQFSQSIHDFSQENCFLPKLMSQHDKWKFPSVMWWISFQDQPWNEHTTTKKTGAEDLSFCRKHRRAARHSKHGLAHGNRLVGLVVNSPASGMEGPEFESHLRQDFSGSSHASDLKNGTPVATLPGAWCYRVSAWTGRSSVSILWLGEVESFICNFYLSVAASKIVCGDPSLRYTR